MAHVATDVKFYCFQIDYVRIKATGQQKEVKNRRLMLKMSLVMSKNYLTSQIALYFLENWDKARE